VADWTTISSLATAGGTLALAVATYASVRSNNRSAQVAELALQEQRRPVLMHSNSDDRAQEVRFADGHRMDIPGGGAAVNAGTDAVYLAASLRNVGEGIAVLQGWQGVAIEDAETHSVALWRQSVHEAPPPGVEDFRPLTRDQYIASGDVGIWQGTVRDPADPIFARIAAASAQEHPISLDLLYTDQVGGQRTISRFGLLPDEGGWRAVVARHFYLDTDAPR
jgi:hypothetical protein